MDLLSFSQTFIDWYCINKRDLPWRQTKDPYKIWVSEVILQQTRVNQGMDYYLRFVDRFPDVKSLADANIDEILRLWQGLGYYSRALNMHATAKFVSNTYSGKFPDTYEAIIQMKGIGEYTASAIASFAFDLPYPVCDGNVLRVISRLFGIDIPITSSLAKKMVQSILNGMLPKQFSSTFNQAIMEFGALQCKPANPSCSSCVFNSSCVAFIQNEVSHYPVKIKKNPVSSLMIDFLFLIDKSDHFLITRRNALGIWRHLYTFPFIDSVEPIAVQDVVAKAEGFFVDPPNYKQSSDTIIHKLSHKRIQARFHIFKGDVFKSIDAYKIIDNTMIDQFGFPQLIVNQFEYLLQFAKEDMKL